MKQFYIKDLAKIINATTTSDITPDSSFSSVSTDSRTTKKGDCFFAIKGPNFDGHDYLLQAFLNSASCAVVSKNVNTKNTLIVKDTLKALGCFAAHYRKTQNFKVVAITGSVGKTTTRHIVHHVLSQKYKTTQAPRNFNNTIGLPLTLLNAEPQHQIVVAELATNQPGEINYLSKIASPEIALVTNVQPAHLEGFADLNAIANEKISIADGLKSDGTLIINADCELLLKTAKQKNLNFITFGKSDRCDIQAKNISCNPSHSTFTIDSAQINLPLPGPGNVENAIAAWALCKQLKIKIEDFASALNSLPPMNMRTQIIKLGKIPVISDCYNANPASMKNALKILTNL
ncbi:MAG: UDP-N-acetylmuramoyl-tripeptide--D-alanyl-D-alanine ligase, partial [Planctomycetota bacterium]